MREDLALALITYSGDDTAAAYRSDLSSADTTNLDSIGNIAVYATNEFVPGSKGRTTLLAHIRFSSSVGSCTLAFVKGQVNTFGPDASLVSTFTAKTVERSSSLTATAFTVGGKYLSEEVIVDLFGYIACKTLITSLNTGTADIWVRMI